MDENEKIFYDFVIFSSPIKNFRFFQKLFKIYSGGKKFILCSCSISQKMTERAKDHETIGRD